MIVVVVKVSPRMRNPLRLFFLIRRHHTGQRAGCVGGGADARVRRLLEGRALGGLDPRRIGVRELSGSVSDGGT